MRFEIRKILMGATLVAILSGSASAAEEEHRHKEPAASTSQDVNTGQHQPGMHMHKSDITHAKDSDVATEFKGEAAELRAQAESHRKLAKLYANRTGGGGGKAAAINYASVAKHCERLAKSYDDAAKAAEDAAAELSK
jgi:hypothetical protein